METMPRAGRYIVWVGIRRTATTGARLDKIGRMDGLFIVAMFGDWEFWIYCGFVGYMCLMVFKGNGVASPGRARAGNAPIISHREGPFSQAEGCGE